MFLGSKFSFDPSIDDGSFLLECSHGGSKRSLAETSVTSTADLSVFSTATRSQFLDNSLDTHSNISDGSVGGLSLGCGGVMGRYDGLRIPSSHSTPRATPHAPSPDVVRIYVPYSPNSPTPTSSPQNGDLQENFVDVDSSYDGRDSSKPNNINLISQNDNKITIKVDTSQEDIKTPVVEFGHFVVSSISRTSDVN